MRRSPPPRCAARAGRAGCSRGGSASTSSTSRDCWSHCWLRALGSARMSARRHRRRRPGVRDTSAAPLLPGLTQWIKARLQGRRGATPLQPYRELARLWRKSVVDPEGTGPVYRSARRSSPRARARLPAGADRGACPRLAGGSRRARPARLAGARRVSPWPRPHGTPATASPCRARVATSPSAWPWRRRSCSPSPAPPWPARPPICAGWPPPARAPMSGAIPPRPSRCSPSCWSSSRRPGGNRWTIPTPTSS